MPENFSTLEKSPFPEREKEVAARLRLARISAGVTLSALSRILKISREKLRNYECGRTVLLFDIAERVSEKVNCNQRWLATGQPPMHPHFSIENVLLNILDGAPGFRNQTFTLIYDKILAERFEERFEIIARSYWRMPGEASPLSREPDLPGIGFGALDRRYFMAQLLGKNLAARVARLPENAFSEIETDIENLAAEYEKKYKEEIARISSRLIFDVGEDFLALERELRLKLCSASSIENPLAETEAIPKKLLTDSDNVDIQSRRYEHNTPVNMQKTIANRIKAARENLGLSQRKAAKKWGFYFQTLQQWEQGRRAPRALYAEKLEAILSEIERAGKNARR